jgi:hypothetical protein
MIMSDDTKIMMQRMGPDECLGDTWKLQSRTRGRNGSIGSFWINGKPEGSADLAILPNKSGRRVRI